MTVNEILNCNDWEQDPTYDGWVKMHKSYRQQLAAVLAMLGATHGHGLFNGATQSYYCMPYNDPDIEDIDLGTALIYIEPTISDQYLVNLKYIRKFLDAKGYDYGRPTA